MAANRTLFQTLTNMFGPYGIDPERVSKKYSLGNSELLRTDSKEEYDTQKLQARQNNYLSNQWVKVENEIFQKSMQYEITRIGAYSDFEQMEFYPEIAATLDILMEESTTVNDVGRVLNIYSESPRVKGILEDLFFNRLDVHVALPMWIRNMCKYGDNFLFLNTDDKRGITGVKQLPNFEIERREGGIYDVVSANVAGTGDEDDADRDKVKFFWRGRDLEFMNWQVAHFRLLGDDRRLPYGTSVLEKARRIWKQLLLSEDAMLVYRVTRAPERRVFKVFVGNIDDEDVQPYVNDIANRFKRTSIIDPNTGQIDLKYNQLANDQDYFIPVREENSPTPIDTLPGASNLDQIADIEYLQRKLFTALRVPKAFLGYEEPQGDGKNLALLDIRFARTINRMQQSALQELNKIAIIHLVLSGLEEEIDNFTLTMNNPSTQSEMLRIQNLQTKVSLVRDATSDIGNGFSVMSLTKARRSILGWSDEESKQDFLEQRVEKAASAELENTANVIKHTGVFDKVDKLYGDINIAKAGGAPPEGGGEGGPSAGGGGFGGGGMGGGDMDLGGGDFGEFGEEGDDTGDDTGDIGGDDTGDIGGDFGGDDTGEAPEAEATEGGDELAEDLRDIDNLLTERVSELSKELNNKKKVHQVNYYKRLVDSLDTEVIEKKILRNKVKIFDEGLRLNEEIESILKNIDELPKGTDE
tara:strand:+ start:9219 stop:11309 length:2091 start_codon:yes stop_codon:yes gene_type:complete